MKYIFIFLLAAFAFYEYIFYIPTNIDTTTNNVSSYSQQIEEPQNTEFLQKKRVERSTQKAVTPKVKTIPFEGPISTKRPVQKSNTHFKCDKRKYCSQMRSYEEAKFFLRNCPKVKMDGDRDGIPCERQFRRYD
jgi:hypothetical protein